MKTTSYSVTAIIAVLDFQLIFSEIYSLPDHLSFLLLMEDCQNRERASTHTDLKKL